MKLVTNKFKLGGLHEKHVVATWDLGNHLSISSSSSSSSVGPVFNATDVPQPKRLIVLTLFPPHV